MIKTQMGILQDKLRKELRRGTDTTVGFDDG